MSDLIYFEERWIKPYAQPVSAADLRTEAVYFLFNYMNDDLIIPKMETVVFIGRNLEVGDEHDVYFQDIRSYRNGVRYDSDQWLIVTSMAADQTGNVFEYEGALDGVLRCELRRRDLEKPPYTSFRGSEGGGFDAATPNSNDRYMDAHPELKDDEALAQFIADGRPSRLEGRELTLDPEPIRAGDLAESAVYYLVEYVDDERLIPVMDTLVFLGRNLEPGDESKVYFQDAFSYNEKCRYGDPDNPNWAAFYIEPENELKNVFEFEHAMEELMRCSVRRRKP